MPFIFLVQESVYRVSEVSTIEEDSRTSRKLFDFFLLPPFSAVAPTASATFLMGRFARSSNSDVLKPKSSAISTSLLLSVHLREAPIDRSRSVGNSSPAFALAIAFALILVAQLVTILATTHRCSSVSRSSGSSISPLGILLFATLAATSTARPPNAGHRSS